MPSVTASLPAASTKGHPVSNGLHQLLDERLPLNRKERFFTGTVLPQIIASDGLAHLKLLLDHLGCPEVALDASPSTTNVQFFTEYGFTESRNRDEKAVARFPTVPDGKDTPDLVIFIDGASPLLVCLEAKMYDVPTIAQLETQMAVQAKLLAGLARDLEHSCGTREVIVVHAALLPASLKSRLQKLAGSSNLSFEAITWEMILQLFEPHVGTNYWISTLAEALERYDKLVGKESVKNNDGWLSGAAIIGAHLTGTSVYAEMYVGRQGGLKNVAKDRSADAWLTRSYEVRAGALPGHHSWFSVADFATAVGLGADAALPFEICVDEFGTPRVVATTASIDGWRAIAITARGGQLLAADPFSGGERHPHLDRQPCWPGDTAVELHVPVGSLVSRRFLIPGLLGD